MVFPGKTTPKVPFFKDCRRCPKILDYTLGVQAIVIWSDIGSKTWHTFRPASKNCSWPVAEWFFFLKWASRYSKIFLSCLSSHSLMLNMILTPFSFILFSGDVIVVVWLCCVFSIRSFFWHNLTLNLYLILYLKSLFWKSVTYVLGCFFIKFLL